MNKQRAAVGVLVFAFVLVLAVGACGTDGESSSDGGRDEPGGKTVVGVDFASGGVAELADGWTLAPCEAGPPLFCLRLDGETRGTLELGTYPVESFPEVNEIIKGGGSTTEALRREAAAFRAVFAKDRPEGCGVGYAVKEIPPAEAAVASRPGLVYGFDGELNGAHVERALQFATVKDGSLHIIAVSGVATGTCMDDPELFQLTVDELTKLEPALQAVVAASVLP